jgi:glycosyltransferase involved in cell wall biosynthesis
MTVHNAAEWIEQSLHSVLSQTFRGKMELSLFNDATTDNSMEILDQFRTKFEERGITLVVCHPDHLEPRGVGYGTNCAIRQSSGKYICVQDADDVMTSDRVEKQYTAAQDHPDAIVGSCFTRMPKGSTERYTRWCNTLTPSQLYTQAFTAFGPTMVKPTWFFARGVYDRAGPFSEDGKTYNLAIEGESSSRVCSVQMESLHNLECRQTGKKALQKFNRRQPSKGCCIL